MFTEPHDPTRIPTSWGWAIGQMFSWAFQFAATFVLAYVILSVVDRINWDVIWKP